MSVLNPIVKPLAMVLSIALPRGAARVFLPFILDMMKVTSDL